MFADMTSVAVVGGGFAGIGAAAMLARAGYRDVTVFEREPRLGGVWNANTYPGAACDIPSHLYEFSFAPNPRWSRRYAPQAEIQAYLEDVARPFDVRVSTDVRSAHFADGRWTLDTSGGEHTADVLITACGQLTTPAVPPLPGLEDFAGPAFHTARWDHDVDLSGKRVAVIGTGCSAIQVVPAIQPEVERVTVFQRSPGWTIPKGDFPYPPWAQRLFERVPLVQRLDRAANYAFHDFAAYALSRRKTRLLRPFRALGQLQIRLAIKDRALRRTVTPTDEIGCKRIMLTDNWYPTLAKPNVTLTDRRIERIGAHGIRTADGVEHPADVLVLATGFRAHDFVAPMEISTHDRTLAQEWAAVPRAYLGVTVPGFPNLFLLYGPNTNGGSGSVVATIEAQLTHVIAALRERERRRARTIVVRREAAQAFDAELRTALAGTVWHSGCTNWYVDEHGNDPSQWPWSWTEYRRRTARLDPQAYETG
ncbi:cation diffusion facilitator CzcD-associated flavoprotein CzcO [Solirubrobacter pauli]|uniref:Cation diffusion facilitator CzcD-associated flavoprotein CzcO n=2 Tax=Solirubrobacter pauli TaxID=166793 RepID=A0A660L8J1_9ACTN|nr:cation diffusion facilitator CzcD-associated flavoprotein CzcO [Solirubrobacter pauli]